MITSVLDGAGTYSEPIMVASDQNVIIQVTEHTADLVATLSIQRIAEVGDPARPNAADTRWTTIKELDFATADEVKYEQDYSGPAFYRVAILAGDYNSGKAQVELSVCQK